MHTNKWLTRTAMPIKTLCILLVVIFLTGVVQIIASQLYWEFSRKSNTPKKPDVVRNEQEKQQWDIHHSSKEFAPDGTVYLTGKVNLPGNIIEKKITVKDRENNILFEGKELTNPYSFIQWSLKKTNQNRYNQGGVDKRYIDGMSVIGVEFSRNIAIATVNEDNKRTGHWFFDMDKRIFKYYSITGEQFGYIGANGYSENISDLQGFQECHRMVNWLRPNTYDPMMIYQSRYAVYQIDFANKGLETLVATDDDPIRRMNLNNWQEREVYEYRPMLIAITKSNKLYLHLKNPAETIETQLPAAFGKYDNPQMAANEDTIFVRFQETVGRPKTKDLDTIMAWYRENRNKAQEYKLRLFKIDNAGEFSEKTSFVWVRPALEVDSVWNDSPDRIQCVLNSVSTPVPIWLTRYLDRFDGFRQWTAGRRRETMSFIGAYSIFKMPVNLCVMVIMAVLALVHGWRRRGHIAGLIFWVVFVFLFNLPGFLTYLAINHRPLIKCADCGQKRGLTQDACCNCGALLPEPESKETDLVMPMPA